MMPGTRKNRVSLRLGMTGVRIPRHVGTWRVTARFEAVDADGNPRAVYAVKSETLENAPRMAVTETGEVVCVKLSATDWPEQLKAAGYDTEAK